MDTHRTALPWSRIPTALEAVEAALRPGLGTTRRGGPRHEPPVPCTPDGASLYTTYLFRLADPEVTMERWRALRARRAGPWCTRGGTISHQHGVGTDHAPYLAAEKGPLRDVALGAVMKTSDPEGLMNPGKLVS